MSDILAIPWAVTCQAPLFMEFSRQKYYSRQLFLSLGNLPEPGIKPGSLTLQADSLPSESPGKPKLPCDPAIPLLVIYPEKTIIGKDTCTPMFTAALFTIARTWKQPKCPPTDGQYFGREEVLLVRFIFCPF